MVMQLKLTYCTSVVFGSNLSIVPSSLVPTGEVNLPSCNINGYLVWNGEINANCLCLWKSRMLTPLSLRHSRRLLSVLTHSTWVVHRCPRADSLDRHDQQQYSYHNIIFMYSMYSLMQERIPLASRHAGLFGLLEVSSCGIKYKRLLNISIKLSFWMPAMEGWGRDEEQWNRS